jgi:general secretion pathway protein G
MKSIRRRPAKGHPPKTPARARGFTLMEVLLVLAILGVIIALVVPNLLGRQQEANNKAARVQIQGVESACELYALDHSGAFPETLDALLSRQGDDNNWKGPYLKSSNKIPNDPWGNPIQYAYPGQNQGADNRPDIWSMGLDKQSNTADDITNWETVQ